VRTVPLWRLPLIRPQPDRILYHELWLARHGNMRYAELLPRFERVDAALFHVSPIRVVAAAEWRVLTPTRPLQRRLLGAAGRRYRWLLATDLGQIPHSRGAGVVADVDDPRFDQHELELLGHPLVRAVVVTAERAGRRLEDLGLDKPWHVVPQGVDLSAFDPDRARAVSRSLGDDGTLLVGFVGSWLLTSGDRRGDNPLWNIDHLLELWGEIRARVPKARLCLVGSPSRRVTALCAGRDDIVLTGPLSRSEVLAHVASFDVALYPRERDQGIASMKIAEYMGAGVPTVSYDYRVTDVLRERGAGILVETPREFVEAVTSLATDAGRRKELGEAARLAGAALDWAVLARRYEREILDRYLPP
jgi:glycosyltransferase involved in cell wall biosynthesis